MNTTKVWYVTGPSQGLGLSLVKKLLGAGYRVAATSRSSNDLQKAAGLNDTGNFLPLLGTNAFERAGEKIESMGQELKKWKELSVSADFR